MEQKRVSVGAEFGHDERNAMLHEPRNVVHVTAEPIQLGNDDRRTFLTGALEGLSKRRAMIFAVLAAFDLRERLGEPVPLRRGAALLAVETAFLTASF